MTDRTWDKEAVYDSEISPLMKRIIEICKREQIPLAASFQFSQGPEGPGHCTTIITSERHDAEPWPHASVRILELARAHRQFRSSGLLAMTFVVPPGDKN